MSSYRYITNPFDLAGVAADIANVPAVGLDIETTGFDPHTCVIRLVQLNTGNNSYVIDLFHTKTLGPVLEALGSDKVIKIVQNAKFEQKFFYYNYGLRLFPLFDTFRASALLYNGVERGHDLYSIYSRELDVTPSAVDMGGAGWGGELTEMHRKYAAEDVEHLLRLREVMRPKLVAAGMARVAQIEFQAVYPEARMELNGIFLDPNRWLEVEADNRAKSAELSAKIKSTLPNPSKQLSIFDPGFDFNLDSPIQVLQSLQMHGAVKLTSTNELELAQFAKKFPIISSLLEYREYSQGMKMFGSEFLKNINSKTGRIHGSYYPFTGAGRYAMSGPNLQQIPRDKRYRACIRAPEGKKWVMCDYSQIELRVAAQITKDPVLMEAYRNKEDIHTKTAALVNGLKPEEVQKPQRNAAKAVNFGLIYGMSPDKLVLYALASYGTEMTLKEAKRFHQMYFDSYRGVAAWHRQVFSNTNRAKGVSRTLAGRFRKLLPTQFNEYSNTPVQGTAADGLKCSISLVQKALDAYGSQAKLVHMVHDELIVEVDDEAELLTSVKGDLERGMVDGMQWLLPDVPVEAEANIGLSWADKS